MQKKKGERDISPAMLKKITDIAAVAAVEAYKKQVEAERRENRDKRLYNTRLLLERYRPLAVYVRDAIYDSSQVDEEDEIFSEIMDLMSERATAHELTVESIKDRVGKIKLILAHINKMLNFYKWDCERTGRPEDARRWQTIFYLYLAEGEEAKNIPELAAVFGVDDRSIYRYIKAATQELSALLFGCIE